MEAFLLELKSEVSNKALKVNGHRLKIFHESPAFKEETVEELSLELSYPSTTTPWLLECVHHLLLIYAYCYIEDNVWFKCVGRHFSF